MEVGGPSIGRVLGAHLVGMLGLVGVVVGLVWTYRTIGAVMSIGGSCGTGSPGLPDCPDGTWMLPVGILGGLVCLVVYIAGSSRAGPRLAFFAWTALFAVIGAQALRQANADGSVQPGAIVFGVVFVLVGLAPVALVLANSPKVLAEVLVGHGRLGAPTPVPRPKQVAQRATAAAVRVASDSPLPAYDAGTGSREGAGTPAAVVDELERLARLHERGQLSAEEFAAAKRQVIGDRER